MTTNRFTHTPSVCPRCQQPFLCRAGAIQVCQCQTVSLTDAQRQFIASLFEGCLCANCLRALQSEYNQLKPIRVS
ncbi:cysteine-rich CWC family protein [Spirosoma sp. SC4-14]|uniref:cysteine-rich CWC family protein n=1 Tax=Spirosoma sp. SC4-14 TaxID=3128900 RepID=UPI0030CD7D3B